MATPAADYGRSPFDNMLNFVPQSHEKALKHAFYNAAAIAFLFFGAAVAGSVYFVLGPFLRPLLWALLCGSVLHPFKHKLTFITRKWLQNLKSTGTPFTVGVLAFPIGVVDNSAEVVGGIVTSYAKALISVTLAIFCAIGLCMFTPTWVVHVFCFTKNLIVLIINSLLCIFRSFWIWTVIIGYVGVVAFYWTPSSSRLLRQLAIPFWAMLLLHLVAIVGSFRVPVCILLFILLGIGFFKEVKDIHDRQLLDQGESETPSITQTAWAILSGNFDTNADISSQSSDTSQNVEEIPEKVKHSLSEPVPSKKPPLAPPKHPSTSIKKSERKNSSMYLWSLIWACGMVQFYYHLWLIPLFAFPLWYFIIKRTGQYFGLWAYMHLKFTQICEKINTVLEERKDAIFPAPIRGIFKLVRKGDVKVLNTLDSALDTFVSLGIIIVMIFLTLFGVIFFAVQIHAESMHMVQVTSNLINRTVVNNPELQNLLPEGLSEVIDSTFDNAYLYVREWSANMVKNMIGEADETKALIIEKQVLELWDRVYHAWMSSNENIQAQAVGQSWTTLLDGLTASRLFDISKITDFVKENIGTFMSVLESLWSVLKGNISLALSAFTATVSLLFGGGTALLNFVINFIVFITALFYLLASSGEQYKLVDIISKMTPAGTGSGFGLAAEEAINGVFAASFKLAFFYGMWTWLIHTLFGVKIVYIPSAVATLLGAVPFLGTYWAAFPAVLELWLVQDKGVQAIIMMVCQFLPVSFVDTSVYSEIKGGGHPYLTGLAVAGGIFCFGIEGALIGPILLCCLFVAINMTGRLMQTPGIDEPSKRPSRSYFFKRTTSIM